MRAENGGTIVNAFGSVGEGEGMLGATGAMVRLLWRSGGHNAWHRRLRLSGERRFPFPTYWQVRDFGLLGANNLYFSGGNVP
jgi:hypothetical protein